jgi:hypothetical protein
VGDTSRLAGPCGTAGSPPYPAVPHLLAGQRPVPPPPIPDTSTADLDDRMLWQRSCPLSWRVNAGPAGPSRLEVVDRLPRVDVAAVGDDLAGDRRAGNVIPSAQRERRNLKSGAAGDVNRTRDRGRPAPLAAARTSSNRPTTLVLSVNRVEGGC